MATTVYLQHPTDIATPDIFSLGTNAANLRGTATGWTQPYPLRPARSTNGASDLSTPTVLGPTAGVEATETFPDQWVSPPVDQSFTLSGTITLNIWAYENNMSANVAINVAIDRIDSTGAIASRIATSARVTELAVSIAAVNNFTVTPTSTSMLKGDRIRVRVFGDDAGTMASTFAFSLLYAGTTAAVSGDSFVTFTETFGFMTTDPTTTTLYPNRTAIAIDPGGATFDSFEAWTTRGVSAWQTVTDSATGWTAPLQSKASLGGSSSASNFEEWYTKQLSAFTLSGPVLANVRAFQSLANLKMAIRAEVAVCAADGTGATVWAATSHPSELTTSQAAYTFYLAGNDLAITNGQRLRIRFYFDDISTTAMVVSGINGGQLSYRGPTPGASGDTFLTFGQVLRELPPYYDDFPTPEWDPAGELTAAAAVAQRFVMWIT